MAEEQPPNLGYYARDLPSVKILSEWWTRFTTNTGKSIADMSPQNWIRLIVIVGTYLLLRPYLLKLGAHIQAKQLEKEAKREEEARVARMGGMNANDLRGGRKVAKVEIPGVESEDEDEGDAPDGESGSVIEVGQGGEWGRKARVRQRKVVRRAVEETDRRLREKAEESDKDIEDLLED